MEIARKLENRIRKTKLNKRFKRIKSLGSRIEHENGMAKKTIMKEREMKKTIKGLGF